MEKCIFHCQFFIMLHIFRIKLNWQSCFLFEIYYYSYKDLCFIFAWIFRLHKLWLGKKDFDFKWFYIHLVRAKVETFDPENTDFLWIRIIFLFEYINMLNIIGKKNTLCFEFTWIKRMVLLLIPFFHFQLNFGRLNS